MTTFSSEQLNFFKFSTVVIDEFPVALRHVFVHMWDTQVAPIPGLKKWDDSLLVRNMFLHREGGKTKYVPTNKSYMEWDCTSLFEATLFAQSFAMPDGKGVLRSLDRLYARPRRLGLLSGTFHPFLTSPSGIQAETFALALDQLRLLRNTLCHQISTQKIDKATFDNYIQLAKDAFAALGQSVTKIDDIGKLGEKDFPTTRLQELEAELRREKFKQIEDNLDQIESQVQDVGSDVKDVKSGVTDAKTKVDELGSAVKTAATGVKTKVDEVGSEVKSAVTDVKTKVDEVGSDVKTALTDVKTKVDEVASEVKSAVTDVKTRVDEVASVKIKVEEVGSDVKMKVDEVGSDVKMKVDEVGSDVKIKVEEVGSDVKIKVEEVGSDVKTAVTDVKTKMVEVASTVKSAVTDVETTMDEVGSDMKELKANICDMKQAMKAGTSTGPFVPDSCVPDNIPYFVGRQEECQAILDHLTEGTTRLVNVWGSPGFGKTSVAINIAHYLQNMKIPVYFVPLRGMKTKEELVTKLLSIFAGAQHLHHVSSSHWLIQCLQEQQNVFVLILDNAEDLLATDNAEQKQGVLRFIDEIFAQCKHIRLLLTTRESLDFLSLKLSIHLEKINVLDEVSSASLVKLLLPDASEDDCSRVVKECGQVPLSIRLMCSIMRQETISIIELLEELKHSPLVEVLDSESFPDDARLKTLINTSFQRLPVGERNAFVSLAVFPGWFEIKEATFLLDVKTHLRAKKIIRSLERKSLVDCGDNFSQFTIHSLLRSFIDEVRRKDQEVEAIFLSAQLRFYDYFIDSFRVANEKFLMGPSNEALETFLDRREYILLSLANGTRDDKLYPKAVDVLSMAELFLYAVLPDEELLFEQLYDTAVREAKKRQKGSDERQLLAARSFCHWGWFSSGHQTWDHSLYALCTNEAGFPTKLSCYYGVYQLLCGKLDDGVSSVLSSVDRLSSRIDEDALRGVIYALLGECYNNREDNEMASHYRGLSDNSFEARFSNLQEDPDIREMALNSTDWFFLLTLLKLRFQFEYDEPAFFQSQQLNKNHTWVSHLIKNNVLRLHAKAPLGRANVGTVAILISSFLKDPMLIEQLILEEPELSSDSPTFALLELLRSYWVEFIDHVLQSGLDSDQSYNAAKQLMESFLYFFKFSGVSLGDLDESVLLDNVIDKTIENVLKSNEQVPSRDMVDIARSYDILGTLKSFLNDHSAAIELHQQAIRVREENIGDHFDTVSSLTNIGCVYFAMKNVTEADKAFRDALELRERLGVYDDVDTANIYFALGENLYTLGNYEKALEAHLQALKLRKKHLGEHKETAHSLHILGATCDAMKNYQKALEYCEKALKMRLELLGEHVDSAESFQILGSIHEKIEDNRSAVQALEAAADMRSNLLGNHKDTACSYHLLGEVQSEMRNYSGALESLQKAWRMRKDLLGENHHETIQSFHLLNRVYEAFALGLESQNA